MGDLTENRKEIEELRKVIREEVRKIVQEAPRFKLKYPPDIEGLTMKFLYLGMQNGAIKLLDDIKKRTGSNANPVSLQIMDSWADVEKQLKKRLTMKGEEALDTFLAITLKHFNTDAPFLRNLFKRYRVETKYR